MRDWLTPLVAVLLGTGGLSTLATSARAVSSLRTGARTRQRAAVEDLVRSRDAAEDRGYEAERDRDFWHDVAAAYRWQLLTAGQEPRPPDPVPPSRRTATP